MKTPQEIIKEFEERFCIAKDSIWISLKEDRDPTELESFLLSVISDTEARVKEEVVDRLERMKCKVESSVGGERHYCPQNQVLSDAIQAIKGK